MIRHIILFTFTEESTSEQVQLVAQKFLGMVDTVEGVNNVVWGKNTSTKGKNKGYEYCMQMDLVDDEALDRYNNHDEHKAVKKLQKSIVEQKLVFDYNV